MTASSSRRAAPSRSSAARVSRATTRRPCRWSTRSSGTSPSYVAEFSTLVDELSADDNVAGLILGGSRGRGVYVREESDWDLYVVLHDSADLAEYATRFPSRHGDRVEVILRSRSGLAGEPAWNRYTFCHVEPLLDRSDGWLTDTLRALTTVDPASAAEPLDGYINLYVRALKGTDES